MTWYDSLLFFHVASAFLLVAAVVVFWAVIIATARPGGVAFAPLAAAITRLANVIVIVGVAGVLVFGVWLAIYVDGYALWDAWIVASLILWAIGTETGRRAGDTYNRAAEGGADAAALRRRGLLFHTVSSLAILVILVLMIYKPGA